MKISNHPQLMYKTRWKHQLCPFDLAFYRFRTWAGFVDFMFSKTTITGIRRNVYQKYILTETAKVASEGPKFHGFCEISNNVDGTSHFEAGAGRRGATSCSSDKSMVAGVITLSRVRALGSQFNFSNHLIFLYLSNSFFLFLEEKWTVTKYWGVTSL